MELGIEGVQFTRHPPSEVQRRRFASIALQSLEAGSETSNGGTRDASSLPEGRDGAHCLQVD